MYLFSEMDLTNFLLQNCNFFLSFLLIIALSLKECDLITYRLVIYHLKNASLFTCICWGQNISFAKVLSQSSATGIKESQSYWLGYYRWWMSAGNLFSHNLEGHWVFSAMTWIFYLRWMYCNELEVICLTLVSGPYL